MRPLTLHKPVDMAVSVFTHTYTCQPACPLWGCPACAAVLVGLSFQGKGRQEGSTAVAQGGRVFQVYFATGGARGGHQRKHN